MIYIDVHHLYIPKVTLTSGLTGGRVYMQRIQSSLLERVELVALRRCIEAILEWPFNDQPGGRLYSIRGALDSVMQACQTLDSQTAKSRHTGSGRCCESTIDVKLVVELG